MPQPSLATAPGHCPICGAGLATSGACPACFMAAGLDATIATTSPSASPLFDPNIAIEEDDFGPYEIEDLLGEGGMGTVYLATQRYPIQRRVALKVVKLGLDTEAILARFNYERQSLAAMDHPSIARVYDAAATRKGRPFFVMEYINGEPITTYCDRHCLGARARLELFQKVCQAVQHAHSKGILHRDIKPSNVLVTEIDGEPVPKIIDFGISKALDQSTVERTLLTEFGQLVGTPEYMSPEAADLVTGSVDATSDVYSLGVLLYELLVGALPFSANFLRKAGLLELLRILREEEVPPLPKKLTQLGNSASDIAARRGTDLAQLRKQLSGDLNWIVMKAVEKSRDRRYHSPHEFLLDIQRHLEDRPVTASPPRLGYRVLKFVRRNRAAVFASAAVLVALTAGVISTVMQSREAIRQGQRAEANASLAQTNQLRAEQQSLMALANATRAASSEKLAQANLNEVRNLAHSLLTDLDDEVKSILGGTALRRSLVKLGSEYLNRAAANAKGFDPSLTNARRRMGDLQASLMDRLGAAHSFEAAIASLEQHLATHPNDDAVRRDLAETYLSLADVTDQFIGRNPRRFKADALARHLLARNPKDHRALHVRAIVAVESDEPDQALRFANMAFQYSPQRDMDLLRRANIAVKAAQILGDGEFERAKNVLEEQKPIVDRLAIKYPANADYRWLQVRWMESQYFIHKNPSPIESIPLLHEIYKLLTDLVAADHDNTRWFLEKAQFATEIAIVEMEFNQRPAGIKRFKEVVAEVRQKLGATSYSPEIAIQLAEIMLASDALFRTEGNRKFVLEQFSNAIDEIQKASRRHPNRQDLRVTEIRLRTGYLFHFGLSGELTKALELMKPLRVDSERLRHDFPDPTSRYWPIVTKAVHGMLLVNLRREKEGMALREESSREGLQLINEFPYDTTLRQEILVGMNTNVGFYYNAFRRYDEAHRIALDALRIAEYAWQRWPQRRSSLQMLFGPTFHLRYQYTSRLDYTNALAISKRIVAAARQSYSYAPTDSFRIRMLASTLINLAGDYERMGMRDECLQTAREAAAIIRQPNVLPEAATAMRRDFASGLLHLAAMYGNAFEFLDAQRLTEEVIAENERIDKLDATASNIQVRRRTLWRELEKYTTSFGNTALAADAVLKQMQLAQAAPNQSPAFQFSALQLNWRYANITGNQTETLKNLSESQPILNAAIKLSQDSPQNLRLLDMAVTMWRDFVVLSINADHPAAALKAAEQTLALSKQLVSLDPKSKVFGDRHHLIEAETRLLREINGIPVPDLTPLERARALGTWLDREVALTGRWTSPDSPLVNRVLGQLRNAAQQHPNQPHQIALSRMLIHVATLMSLGPRNSLIAKGYFERRLELAREARATTVRALSLGPLSPEDQELDWGSKILLATCEKQLPTR